MALSSYEVVATEQPLAGFLPAVISLRPGRSGALCSSGLPEPQKLTLRELEALARALLSVLLAFLHARIARQKSVLTQRRPQLRIEPRNGPRQSHAHRARLSAHAAAVSCHHHVHLVGDIGEFQRLDPVLPPRLNREKLFHLPVLERIPAASRAPRPS